MNDLSRPWLVVVTLLGAVSFTGCAARYTVYRSGLPANRVASVSKDETVVARTFDITTDWSCGPYVIKRGATLTFRPDGLASFSGRVHTTAYQRGDELYFRSVQFGRDGNVLFVLPASDMPLPVFLRTPHRDYPVDATFGFDKRHFDKIVAIDFQAMLRTPMNVWRSGAPESKPRPAVDDIPWSTDPQPIVKRSAR